MAITVAELVARLTLDKGQFERDVARTNIELEGMGAKATGVAKAFAGALGPGVGSVVPLLGGAALGATALAKELGKATAAAAEEEVNINHLNAALAANIPFWNGNTDAIEQTIAARQSLAFADDQLRDSLAQLVTRTHDANKAFDLQSIAMDLARGRQIDLATASNIVGRVFAGNTAILTRYGIAVEKGATAQEALAKIQSTYAGQAESYAKTTVGSSERVGIALANLGETIGTVFTPGVEKGNTALAEFIETMDRGIQKAHEMTANDPYSFTSALTALIPGVADYSTPLEKALDTLNAKKPDFIKQAGEAGKAWSTELVAGVGAGLIPMKDAVDRTYTQMDITRATATLGGKVGEGFVLYTADGIAKVRPALATEVGFTQDTLKAGIDTISSYQKSITADTQKAIDAVQNLGDTLRGALGPLKAAADEARAWESIGQVGSPTGREALANAQRAANSAQGAKAASDAVKEAEKARKDAADAKAAADKAAYAQTPQGQVDAAVDAARTQDAVDKLKAGNKAYIDALVQGQKDANDARDKLERAQKAAGLITETTAERDAKAVKAAADAAYKATPAGQLDTAIQQSKTEIEINRLKSTNKAYIDAVVQGQLEANKARDALEVAQKAAGLIEYTTLEQEAKRKQDTAINALQSSLDFFTKVQDFKTDVRANVDAVIDNLDYTLKRFSARAQTWKAGATDEIGKIAAVVKSEFEALSAALNPMQAIADAGMVQTYEIDAAFANVDYALDKLDKLGNSPRFQGANLQGMVDRSAALTYAFTGLKTAVETVNSIGEQQQRVDSGEVSYGLDQIVGAASAYAGAGASTGGGGSTVNNYNWNGTIVATPEMRTLIEQFFQYLRDTGGGQMVGAGA